MSHLPNEAALRAELARAEAQVVIMEQHGQYRTFWHDDVARLRAALGARNQPAGAEQFNHHVEELTGNGE